MWCFFHLSKHVLLNMSKYIFALFCNIKALRFFFVCVFRSSQKQEYSVEMRTDQCSLYEMRKLKNTEWTIMMNVGLTTCIIQKYCCSLFKWNPALTKSLTYCLRLQYKLVNFYLNTYENVVCKHNTEDTTLLRHVGYRSCKCICLRKNTFSSELSTYNKASKKPQNLNQKTLHT